MTIQEAIEVLKEEYKYEQLESYVNEALEIAIEAMEKQIPKKPIKKNPVCYDKRKDGNELYAYDYHCPYCDRKVNKGEHHCRCGQALDWEEDNEDVR